VEDAGYIPNANVPDYAQFVKLVEKVRPLEAQVKKKPAVLEFNPNSAATSKSENAESRVKVAFKRLS
jgi:phosphonate transport system substrate-binding protein